MTTKATKLVPNTQSKPRHCAFRHCCIKENFALAWLDENYNDDTSNCDKLTERLKALIRQLDLFNDADDCADFIENIRDCDVYLIITCPAEKTLTHIHQLDQVKAIFIFDDHNSFNESLVKQWPKVQGVYQRIEQLSQGVQETAENAGKDFKEFSTMPEQGIDKLGRNELDPSFMYMQLVKEILIKKTYVDNSAQELVTYCRKHPELIKEKPDGVDEFEKDYEKGKKTPIWWYTKEIFLYHLVNRSLREQEFDTIIRVGFFVKALHKQIVELQNEQNSSKTKVNPTMQSHSGQTSPNGQQPDFYRGQRMTAKEFETLQKGGLIAFNCFLSTSRDSGVAETFPQGAPLKDTEVGIIFQIFVGKSIDSATYADIDKLSFHEGEKEVLFTLGTVFRITSVAQHLKKPKVYDVALRLTDDKDKTLDALKTRIQQESQGFSFEYRWGALMIRVGQYQKAKEAYTELLERTIDKVDQANIQFQLGFIEYKVGDPKQAVELYNKALPIHRKTFLEEHENVATVYSNIGLAYDALDDYANSLHYYQKAQRNYEKIPRSAFSLAVCYNNIASIYQQQGNDDAALDYYKKALEIYKTSDMNDPDVATLHNNIGVIRQKKNDNKEALESFQQAVKIGQKTLPKNHPNLLEYRKNLEELKKKVIKC